MGFSVLLILAVLRISPLCAGGNSASRDAIALLSLINNTVSSNDHPRHSREPPSKNEDQSILDFNFNLELVESKEPPEDAVLVNEELYILLSGKCDKVKLDVHKKSAANNEVRQFLVNKDNFEMLEWKTWEDIHTDRTPVFVVVICKSYYISRENGNPSLIKTDSKKAKNKQTELLTLNYDIKFQHLQIDSYEIKEEKRSEALEVLKQFIAHNRNCDPAKHVVKLDQGSDKSQSFLKGRTHVFGGAIEASVSGQIPSLVNLGGKLTVKYDQSRLTSETTSNLDKALHSVSMEIQVPPNQSCTVEITSKTFMVQVPYTGRLIRTYRNGEERTTSITGILDHQEVAELLTSVKPCTPLPDGTKCSKP